MRRNGVLIGQVREVHVWTARPLHGINTWYWPQGVDRPTDTPEVPDTQITPVGSKDVVPLPFD